MAFDFVSFYYRIKYGLSNEANILDFISMLMFENKDIQLKTAKDFYLLLLNELKKVKRDENLTFLDDLMPKIKELANEDNQNLIGKYACIYILTSLISLDKINFKIRKKHKKSIIQYLKNLLSNTDVVVINMAARALGKFVEDGIDCDTEYKSSLDALYSASINQSRRYQNIVLIKELTFAYPSRFFLFIKQYFQVIKDAMCDKKLNIRYETAELFRLTLMLTIQREMSRTASKINRTSSSLSIESFLFPKMITLEKEKSFIYETNLDKFKSCFETSLKELESLGNSNLFDEYHKIHGCLLVILEIARFSDLEFEKTIEKYLYTYNLLKQRVEVIKNRCDDGLNNVNLNV